jgi:hypothetical protein
MTQAEFLQAFPQFTSIAAKVAPALAEAALFVGEMWEEKAPLGLGNYAAHKLVWDAVTAGEPITAFDADVRAMSKSVGRASLTRSAELLKLAWDETFLYTKYGRRYLELQRLIGAGAYYV